MADDISWLQWALNAAGGIGGAGMLLVLKRQTDLEKTHRVDFDALEHAHNEHVLYAERSFVKNESMERVYKSLDDMQKTMQGMAIAQGTQAANLQNMATTMQGMAQTIKEKAS